MPTRTTHDESTADPTTRPSDVQAKRVVVDGHTLAYDEAGSAAAPTVVLVHGIIDSRLMWRDLVDRLADDYRVLAVDLLGHGESDRISDRDDFDDIALVPEVGEALAGLCQEVATGPVTLVGHSLGGAVSAYLASAHPEFVTGVFLLDPAMFIVDPEVFATTPFRDLFEGLELLIRDAQRREDPEAVLREAIAVAPSMTGRGTFLDVLGDAAAKDLARSWATVDIEMLHGVVESGADPSRFWGDHDPDSPISRPVTVVRADPALGPAFFEEHEERFQRLAPQTRFIEAKGCSHLIHVDAPDWMAVQVMAFLEELHHTDTNRAR